MKTAGPINRTLASEVPWREIFRYFLSLAIIAIFFFPAPAHQTYAQNADKGDDYETTGETVSVGAKRNWTKMPDRSFNEFSTQSANRVVIEKTKSRKGTVFHVLNIEFANKPSRQAVFSDRKRSKISGAYVLTVMDRFADVFVADGSAWSTIKKDPNVVRAESVKDVIVPPPPEGEDLGFISQAIPEKIIRGGYRGLTGKGVIIAIIDTGIDFRHRDFITYDSQGKPTSRLLYFWDTATPYQAGRGSKAAFKFPNGTSIGTLYTKNQLTAELRSNEITIPATDLNGHGTACAGIATGNGNADKQSNGLNRQSVVGVAPEADIIGVRLGRLGLENRYLLNAISEWVDTVAGKQPLVVSGSFGGHQTGHDGQTIQERQLNSRFPLNKVGRALILAAGNDGNQSFHAKAVFGDRADAKLIKWNTVAPTDLLIYFSSAERSIVVEGTKSTSVKKRAISFDLNRITGQLSATLKVKAGRGGVSLYNTSGRPTESHLYFDGRGIGEFVPSVASYSHLVIAPGTAENAITVGSYDWNDSYHKKANPISIRSPCRGKNRKTMPIEIGWLSCYSSPGPTRSGKNKPEIVAPGQWFEASLAKIPGGGAVNGWSADLTGNYALANGTSAATPYTAGIVALMFQTKPNLTLGEIKTLLKRRAGKAGLNPYTQALPNKNWGYGKLDRAAVERIFNELSKE